jgi:uncharacterized protein
VAGIMHVNEPTGAPNRLAGETSPYLLQHAHNPVAWYPWSDAALTAARRENKPILLSIGYSACHWCHVMAHESFEDPQTAALMNELFINIKVDREERPDLDKIYQIAQQMLTQRSGGWPLTMFLSPADGQAFFGGTYFPNEARYGMPAFADIIRRVAQYYSENTEQIRTQNAELRRAFEQMLPPRPPAGLVLDGTPISAARDQLAASFDARFGGFGAAPKFPHPTSIETCLAAWRSTAHSDAPDLHALYMATLTLTRMAEGGIYDQLAGGFCRYSVDDFWMIPHFEKMLYDNAALLANYAQASLATAEPLFARVAQQTADWLLRDMHSSEGCFYSSLDADSEGHEGKFYVWQKRAVEAALSAGEFAVLSRRFGLDREPNFEGEYHLHGFQSVAEIAAALKRSEGECETLLDSAREKLLPIRERRVRPGRDDKILTAWNALTIRGLAIAARAFSRVDFAAAARRALDFMCDKLWTEGRLVATWKDGRARFAAYLDDYAFLADAALDLLQTRWHGPHLEFLRALLEVLLTHFEDRAAGGFFFTADDHERLIHRSKSFADDAVPSGNGIAAAVLIKTGFLLGETRYLDAAERCLKAGWTSMQRAAQAHVSMVTALDLYLHSPQIVIVRGTAAAAEDWVTRLGRGYEPKRLSFAIPNDAADLPDALGSKRAHAGTVAYVCTGTVCSAPIPDFGVLLRRLRGQ